MQANKCNETELYLYQLHEQNLKNRKYNYYYHQTKFISSESTGLNSTVGIATTVTTVVAKIANFTNVVGYGTTASYGDYTWGKVNLTVRLGTKQTFEAVHGTSQAGIGSNPVLRRRNPLRYKGYIIS